MKNAPVYAWKGSADRYQQSDMPNQLKNLTVSAKSGAISREQQKIIPLGRDKSSIEGKTMVTIKEAPKKRTTARGSPCY